MANNEGVDIIIKATDQYTKTINNIAASNKLFGNSIENTQKQIAALEKYMIALVANGISPTSASINVLQADLKLLNQTINTSGTSLKNSNKQWSALALVVQDLPYGFRGIQNNLPALFGSLATGAGAAYFAFSAVVAAITAWDMGLFKVFETTKKATDAQDDYNKALNSAISSGYGEISQIKALVSVVNNQTLSIDQRRTALKKLQDEYPGYFKNMSLEQTSVDDLTLSVGELTKAIIARAEATAMTSEIEKIAAQRYNNTKAIEKNELAITNLKNSLVILSKESQYVSGGFGAGAKKLASPYTQALIEIQKLEKANKSLETSNESLQNSMSLLQNSVDFRTGMSAGLNTNAPKGGKTAEQIAKERLKAIQNANQAEIKAYIETLNERDKKEYEAGIKLANNLEIMRAAGYTDSTTYYAAYRAEMDNIATYYNNKEIEEARKTAEKIARDAEIIDNIELQNSLDSLKIQSDVAMKIANLSGNANAADRIKILEDYKNGLYDLASIGGYTAEQFDKIDDAIKRVDGAIEGSKDRVKDYTVTWQETSNAINGILTNLVRDSIAKFAENVGKAIAGEKVDVFGGFAEMIADGAIAIGKALIAYGVAITAFKFAKANPLLAVIAGAGLVAAGSFLKSKLSQDKNSSPTAFANGGIVSGPTMGLMGEYPGASSNPEVVAPLDKLKSLIGGGGGTLEARISGNDLLILMNKASRNNQSTY
jgi:hypothetical protein